MTYIVYNCGLYKKVGNIRPFQRAIATQSKVRNGALAKTDLFHVPVIYILD